MNSSFLIILLFVPFLAFSQLKVSDILQTSENDIAYKTKCSIYANTQELKFNSLWLNGIEGKFGISGTTYKDTIYGYLRNEDNYGLILSFNSIREIKKQKEIKKYYLQKIQAEADYLLESALVKRYNLIIDKLFLGEELLQLNILDKLLEKKQSILQKLIENNLVFNLKDVLEVEEGRSKSAEKLIQCSANIQKTQIEISNVVNIKGEFDIDTNQLISVQQIKSRLNNFLLSVQKQYGSEYYLKLAKINLSSANLNYVHSQEKRIFERFHIAYDNPLYLQRPKKFNTFNNFSIRTGLKLPITANNNLKKAESAIDKLEKQNELELFRMNANLAIGQKQICLSELIKEYDLVQDLIQKSLVSKLLTNPLSKEQLESLEWFNLQIRFEESKLHLIEIAKEIYTGYINFLLWSGTIANDHRKNFLSSSQEIY